MEMSPFLSTGRKPSSSMRRGSGLRYYFTGSGNSLKIAYDLDKKL
jgi:hypothetical protein